MTNKTSILAINIAAVVIVVAVFRLSGNFRKSGPLSDSEVPVVKVELGDASIDSPVLFSVPINPMLDRAITDGSLHIQGCQCTKFKEKTKQGNSDYAQFELTTSQEIGAISRKVRLAGKSGPIEILDISLNQLPPFEITDISPGADSMNVTLKGSPNIDAKLLASSMPAIKIGTKSDIKQGNKVLGLRLSQGRADEIALVRLTSPKSWYSQDFVFQYGPHGWEVAKDFSEVMISKTASSDQIDGGINLSGQGAPYKLITYPSGVIDAQPAGSSKSSALLLTKHGSAKLSYKQPVILSIRDKTDRVKKFVIIKAFG